MPDIESSIQLVEVDAANKIYYIEMGYYGHNHDPKSCQLSDVVFDLATVNTIGVQSDVVDCTYNNYAIYAVNFLTPDGDALGL